jgi:hypothetical protein
MKEESEERENKNKLFVVWIMNRLEPIYYSQEKFYPFYFGD